MVHRRRWLVMALLALVGFAIPTFTQAASGKTPKAGKVEGTLVGVASNGVVIQRSNGTQVSLGVTAATKVELNGVRVPVTSLPIGSRAQALFDPATSTPRDAAIPYIPAEPYPFQAPYTAEEMGYRATEFVHIARWPLGIVGIVLR